MAETNWMRNREGMGLWEHRGKVAVVGWGQSHIDRRWDGVTLDRSCGGLTKEACLKAIADAGLTLDEDPGINFLSNLPGRAPGEVPAGAPVELIFEKTSNGQMIPEWQVTHG